MTVPLLEAPLLANVEGLLHGFTTRQGGVSGGPFSTLNLGRATSDDDAHVAENYRRLAERLGVGPDRFVTARQVHGVSAVDVESAERRGEIARMPADILIARRPVGLLAVRVADCYPVLIVDPVRKAAAAVHAGWRGILERVVSRAVAALTEGDRTKTESLRAAVGPGICRNHFPVSAGVAALFQDRFPGAAENPRAGASEVRIDLRLLIVRDLREAGIAPERFWLFDGCTACDAARFFSHRREGKRTGRMVGFVGWVA